MHVSISGSGDKKVNNFYKKKYFSWQSEGRMLNAIYYLFLVVKRKYIYTVKTS